MYWLSSESTLGAGAAERVFLIKQTRLSISQTSELDGYAILFPSLHLSGFGGDLELWDFPQQWGTALGLLFSQGEKVLRTSIWFFLPHEPLLQDQRPIYVFCEGMCILQTNACNWGPNHKMCLRSPWAYRRGRTRVDTLHIFQLLQALFWQWLSRSPVIMLTLFIRCPITPKIFGYFPFHNPFIMMNVFWFLQGNLRGRITIQTCNRSLAWRVPNLSVLGYI